MTWRNCWVHSHKFIFLKITLPPSCTIRSVPSISCTQQTSSTETSSQVISLSTRIVASKFVISVLLDRCQKRQIKKRNSVITERNREKSSTKMHHQKSKICRENSLKQRPQHTLMLPSQKRKRKFATCPTVLCQDGTELQKLSLLRRDTIKQSTSGAWDASCQRWSIAQTSTKETTTTNKMTDSSSQEHLVSLSHHATRWPTRFLIRRSLDHLLTLFPKTIKWLRS